MNAPGRVAMLRLCCVMIGLLCAGGIVELFRLGITGSGLRIPAGSVAAGGVVLSVWFAFRSTVWWESVLTRLSDWLRPQHDGNRDSGRHLGIVLIVAALLSGLAGSWRYNEANFSFHDEDEEAYLDVAREIDSGPGFIEFWGTVFSGEFREANRHPLPLWLMSTSPRFERQKLVSGLFALAAFSLTVICVSRSEGVLAAGTVAVLLATNAAFLRFSATVSCESLLVLLVPGVWVLAVSSAGAGRRTSLRGPVLCGLLLGLCWLTKGTGLVLTAGFAIWVVLRQPFRPGSDAESDGGAGRSNPFSVRRNLVAVGLLASTWLLVASPLLVRNVRVYGSPFHNVNSWLMFADAYEDPVALSEQASLGEAARTWWSSHSMVDVLRREASGLVWESYIIVRMLGPAPFDDARFIPGLLLALLAIIGAAISPSDERWLLAIWLLVCGSLFAWYIPVAAGERFPLPLLVPILIMSGRGLLHTVTRLAGSKERVSIVVLVSGLAWIALVELTWVSGLISLTRK